MCRLGKPPYSLALLFLVGVISLQRPALAASDKAPQGVSPGSPFDFERLADSCPTFSWTPVDDARGYELVLYRLGSDGILDAVLRQELPAGATSWTPPAAKCPATEAEHTWVIRALGRQTDAWSDALRFTTAGAPSDDEVRRAMQVLRARQAADEQSVQRDTTAEGMPTGSGRRLDPPGVQEAPAPTSRAEPLLTDTVGSSTADRPGPGIVTTPTDFALNLAGPLNLNGDVFKNGSPFIHTDGGPGYGNTAVGLNALVSTTPGAPYPMFGRGNSAFGHEALAANSIGFSNSAVGYRALASDTYGWMNTALGARALESNSLGNQNTAVGYAALSNNTGSRNTSSGYRALYSNLGGFNNTANGYRALFLNTSGNHNTAVGYSALFNNETGFSNTAIGRAAGYEWTTGNHNIAIGSGSYGVAGESLTTRIGGMNRQTRTFVEGIRGATSDDDVAGFDQEVCVDQFDQLGPCIVSSARFKRDIADMGDVAAKIAGLRPVTFRYRDSGDDARTHYGLIAEEVAETFPGLVIYDEQHKPFSVRYHLLTPLLLDELQRLAREVADLRWQAHAAAVTRASTSPMTVVPLETASLSIDGDINLGGFLFQGGGSLLHTTGGVAYENTAAGLGALTAVTPGTPVSAAGSRNTALGYNALRNTTIGFFNTAVGTRSLHANVDGNRNTAIGYPALSENTSGYSNTAIGYRAMQYNLSGTHNTAIGASAGINWTTGSSNIAIGRGASGVAGEAGVIRIGGTNQHTTFIAGIDGATVAGGTQVFVDSSDQLGTLTSSSRFKRDIRALSGIGERLEGLRPVSFRYRDEVVQGDANPIEYGLIAEEVAEIFPELVAYDRDDRPSAVRYHLLIPLLLAQLQEQEGELGALRRRMDALDSNVCANSQR